MIGPFKRKPKDDGHSRDPNALRRDVDAMRERSKRAAPRDIVYAIDHGKNGGDHAAVVEVNARGQLMGWWRRPKPTPPPTERTNTRGGDRFNPLYPADDRVVPPTPPAPPLDEVIASIDWQAELGDGYEPKP